MIDSADYNPYFNSGHCGIFSGAVRLGVHAVVGAARLDMHAVVGAARLDVHAVLGEAQLDVHEVVGEAQLDVHAVGEICAEGVDHHTLLLLS